MDCFTSFVSDEAGVTAGFFASFLNTTSSWICTEVEVDGETETIKSTAEHPFFVLNANADRQIVNFEGRDNKNANGQWIAAKDLKVGDNCLLSNGKTGIISKQKIEYLAEPETTYNFEVADFHTYYVGENGILVHNDCLYQYLDEALQRQGLDKVPEGGFKETWIKDGYKIEVRTHAGNP